MKDLVPSVPEIRNICARILLPPPARRAYIFQWSHWRRRHQAMAAQAHYRRNEKIHAQL
jgi:hypothetical protein